MTNIRTFVAIGLDAPLHRALARVINELRARAPTKAVRWVDADNIHLTLSFLGDVPAARIPAIAQGMGRVAQQVTPFWFDLGGLGCFPTMRRPRVIWIGVHEPTGALHRLHRLVSETLEEMGYPREERPFSPHLTLGRVRRETSGAELTELGKLIEGYPIGNLGRQIVSTIHVFKSDLRPEGPIYTPLATLKLGPETRKGESASV